MLKKKKTTASGKLVLVKSVRRHWTSGGCPFSADRSGTETRSHRMKVCVQRGLLASFHFKFLGQLCQFFHRFLGVTQQGVTHFWRTAGIKHFHLIDTLILQRNIWIYKGI